MRVSKVNSFVAAANTFGGDAATDYIKPVAPNNVVSRARMMQLAEIMADEQIVQDWAKTQAFPGFEYDFAVWELCNATATAEQRENKRLHLLGANFPHVEDVNDLLKLKVTGN